jgi:hypothetical protein
MHVGESEGGLVPLSTIKKPTLVVVFLNWIVNDWRLYEGSTPSIHIGGLSISESVIDYGR